MIALCFGGVANADVALRPSILFSARATYDTNVARSDVVRAALRGIKRQDTLYSPRMTIDAERSFGRQSLFLEGDIGYDFYQRNRQLNREHIALQGGGRAQLGLCRGVVTGAYSRQQSDLQDLKVEVTKNVATGRRLSVDISCGRKIGFTPTLSVSRAALDNSNPLRFESDSRSTSVKGGLAYSRPTFGEISALATYRKTDFPHRLLSVGGMNLQDGFETYAGGLSYTRELGARIQGNAQVFYTAVRPSVPGSEAFHGLTYLASLSFRPTSKLNAKLDFGRQVDPSNRTNGTYTVARTLAVTATYKVGGRGQASIGASRTDHQNRGALFAGPIDIPKETVKAVYGSLEFDVSRRVAVILDARHEVRDAAAPGFSYVDNRAGLSANLSF